MSKMRYGLQITNKVRILEEDMKTKGIKVTQLAQNILLSSRQELGERQQGFVISSDLWFQRWVLL